LTVSFNCIILPNVDVDPIFTVLSPPASLHYFKPWL